MSDDDRKFKGAMINNLPDVILQHILCFIPTKLAISTSLLSRRWKIEGAEDWISNVMKQEIFALSSGEAEFMAATEEAKQAVWLQEFLSEVVG